MEVGTGIAAGSFILGLTVFGLRLMNGKDRSESVCPMHSGIDVTLKSLTGKIDDAAHDIKRILVKIGGV